MKVDFKKPKDLEDLRRLVRDVTDAKQRDRYRVVLIAGEGLSGKTDIYREQIALVVGRSRQFVDEWVGRYRDGGLETLVPKRQLGAKPKLSPSSSRSCAG
jgi:transposase